MSGAHFLAGARVEVSGDSINVGTVTVTNDSRIVATFVIAPEASAGPREVTVSTTQGRSAALTFTVKPKPLSPPTLTSITPTAYARNSTVDVTLTGTQFVEGATVAVSGSGVTVGAVVVVNSTTIQTTFAITGGATLGDRDVTVTTPGGTTDPVTFRVVPSPPELYSVTPASGARGTTVSVTLVGAYFTAASSVMVNGVGVTVGAVTVTDEGAMTVMLIIAADAPLGDRLLTVTDEGGTSPPKTFTVVAG